VVGEVALIYFTLGHGTRLEAMMAHKRTRAQVTPVPLRVSTVRDTRLTATSQFPIHRIKCGNNKLVEEIHFVDRHDE
jgi:hypothetical protein